MSAERGLRQLGPWPLKPDESRCCRAGWQWLLQAPLGPQARLPPYPSSVSHCLVSAAEASLLDGLPPFLPPLPPPPPPITMSFAPAQRCPSSDGPSLSRAELVTCHLGQNRKAHRCGSPSKQPSSPPSQAHRLSGCRSPCGTAPCCPASIAGPCVPAMPLYVLAVPALCPGTGGAFKFFLNYPHLTIWGGSSLRADPDRFVSPLHLRRCWRHVHPDFQVPECVPSVVQQPRKACWGDVVVYTLQTRALGHTARRGGLQGLRPLCRAPRCPAALPLRPCTWVSGPVTAVWRLEEGVRASAKIMTWRWGGGGAPLHPRRAGERSGCRAVLSLSLGWGVGGGRGENGSVWPLLARGSS